MLFAELDWPSIGGGATAATVVGLIIKAAEMWFSRKDKKEADLIEHFKLLLTGQKQDCDEEVAGLKAEMHGVKVELEVVRKELTTEKVGRAKDVARIQYLEDKYRDLGGKDLKPWDTDTHKSLRDDTA